MPTAAPEKPVLTKFDTFLRRQGPDVSYNAAILDAVRNTPAGEKIAPIDLPLEYYKAAGELARKRIVAAGVRLGTMLKSISQ